MLFGAGIVFTSGTPARRKPSSAMPKSTSLSWLMGSAQGGFSLKGVGAQRLAHAQVAETTDADQM
eukprot:11942272-Alexandrium_andersonii.AAC.1